jgi:hypothetical protein
MATQFKYPNTVAGASVNGTNKQKYSSSRTRSIHLLILSPSDGPVGKSLASTML